MRIIRAAVAAAASAAAALVLAPAAQAAPNDEFDHTNPTGIIYELSLSQTRDAHESGLGRQLERTEFPLWGNPLRSLGGVLAPAAAHAVENDTCAWIAFHTDGGGNWRATASTLDRSACRA